MKILSLRFKNKRRHKKAYAFFSKLKLSSYKGQISTQDGWASAADALAKEGEWVTKCLRTVPSNTEVLLHGL